MSVAPASKCIFCTFARSARQVPVAGRSFSSTPSQHVRKPKFPSIKAKTKTNLKKVPVFRDPTYVERTFTPEQRAAIEAADKVVNDDKLQEVKLNRHPWSMNYVDDLTRIDPGMDHTVKQPWKNIDENSRLKTEEEFDEDFYKLMNNLPDDDQEAAEAWRKFDQNMRLTVGKEEAERRPRTALAGEIPETETEESRIKKAASDAKSAKQNITPEFLRLMQLTGLTREQILSLKVKTIITHRVVNQTRLGKIFHQYALSVAGNGNGLVGLGEGKSDDGGKAALQSQYRAIRNMQPILRYENRTTFGEVNGKVSATELELYARPPGFGLRCQQYIYEICRAAGISDLAARVTRSKNPMNTAKATMQALLSQKDPEEIAKARGKKMVDVRKVYYANQV